MKDGGDQSDHIVSWTTGDRNDAQTNSEVRQQFIQDTSILGDALEITGVPKTYVIGNNLATATEEVSDTLYHKIVQCFNYARSVADGPEIVADVPPIADRIANLEAWYRRYFWGLMHTGLWIDSGPEHWVTVRDQERGLDVHSAIVNVLSAIFGPGVQTTRLITDSLTKLTDSANSQSPWFILFYSTSKSFNVPCCQISITTHNRNEPVTLHVLVFTLDVTQLDAQLLFFRWTAHHETFKYYMHTQRIDEQGLRTIDQTAAPIAERMGTLGPRRQ